MTGTRCTVVTGSRSGIGGAVANLLRLRGQTVIGIDLADADITADLSTAAGWATAVDRVHAQRPEGIDAVIACAGIANNDGPRMIAVNYFGAVELVSGLRPLLARGSQPRAVAVASSANLLPSDPALVTACLDGDEDRAMTLAQDNALSYASSKLALTRWIRRTAITSGWADAGLLLNGVAPGLVRTPMTLPMLDTEEGRALLDKSAPRATAHAAEPDDIALLLAFLASADNRYMVGQVPYCDGGKDVLLRGDDIIRPVDLAD